MSRTGPGPTALRPGPGVWPPGASPAHYGHSADWLHVGGQGGCHTPGSGRPHPCLWSAPLIPGDGSQKHGEGVRERDKEGRDAEGYTSELWVTESPCCRRLTEGQRRPCLGATSLRAHSRKRGWSSKEPWVFLSTLVPCRLRSAPDS